MNARAGYMRFHGHGRTDMAARDSAKADGGDRVGLIGHHGDSVVAVAGFDGLRERGVAEVAFAVVGGNGRERGDPERVRAGELRGES